MPEVTIDPETIASAKGRVIVLTGGAQGIGAATVSLFYHAGAHVFFGDWDHSKGSELCHRLNSGSANACGTVKFLKVDVRDYASQLALFDAAFAAFGRVDTAISCAAVTERTGWFEPANLNLETVRKNPLPVSDVIDINLISVISFTRLALAFMSHDFPVPSVPPSASPTFSPITPITPTITSPKSLVLLSSVAGFKESPGLFAYSSAKHGVLGLMRSLRPYTPSKYNIRVNAICPWATDTQLLSGVHESWVENKMPLNQPVDVAKVIAQVVGDEEMHGEAVYVAGGKAYGIERGINETERIWLGEGESEALNRGQVVLGMGSDWGIQEY